MPIYEYKCATCGHVFEDMVLSSKDPGPQACPKCADAKIERLISGTNFQLKGGGWFHSDYGKPASAAPPKAEAAAETSESSAPAAPATPATTSSDT